MTSKLMLIVGAAACVVAASTAADAKHRKWHHAPQVQAHQSTPTYGMRQEPARMIEIRPGLFISSYGCVTDEGNGRYLPCGAGRSD